MSWMARESECEQVMLASAWVLGALEEADEAERYAEHLLRCDVCAQEVAELAPVVQLLPVSVPSAEAPAALRDRVTSVVAAESELLHAAGHGADRPTVTRRRRTRPLGALAGALAMGTGVVVGAVALHGEHSPVTRQSPGVVTGTGSAVLRQSAGRSELDVSNLSQPPAGDIYQVWLARGRRSLQPTDALFGVDRRGRAEVNVPGSLRGVSRLMVTAEPPGGSPSGVPTGPPVLKVAVGRS